MVSKFVLVLIIIILFIMAWLILYTQRAYNSDLNVNRFFSKDVFKKTPPTHKIQYINFRNGYINRLTPNLDLFIKKPIKCNVKPPHQFSTCKENSACVNLTVDTELVENGKSIFVWPKNLNPEEGYCIPLPEYSKQHNYALTSRVDACNPKTGIKYMFKYYGDIISACKRKNPRLYDQSVPVTGDCDKVVACRGGSLEDLNTDNELNLSLMRCINCGRGLVSDRDEYGLSLIHI